MPSSQTTATLNYGYDANNRQVSQTGDRQQVAELLLHRGLDFLVADPTSPAVRIFDHRLDGSSMTRR